MVETEQLELFTQSIIRYDFGRNNPIGFLENDPQKVVRELHGFKYLGVTQKDYTRYSKVINAWREFGSYPGIRVPNFIPYSNFFVVVDFVEGETLDKKQFQQNSEEILLIRSFLDSLVNYTADKCHNGGLYLSDQKTEQYMYGTTQKDNRPGVYFVDLDYEMVEINPEKPSGVGMLIRRNSFVFKEIESRFKPGIFNNERVKLQILIEEVLKKHNYPSIRDALEVK